MITNCLLLFVPLGALLYPYLKKYLLVKQWYNKWDLKRHQQNHYFLFKEIDGFTLSQQARMSINAIEYTYGEIEFISFVALLSLAKPDSNTVFYDLGSGTGKAVLACAMVFNVKKSCGIELFSALHQAASKQRSHLQQLDYNIAGAIDFIQGDFLHANFSDATLIFINATAFFGESWVAVQNCLQQLKAGAFIITTSKKLSSEIAMVVKVTQVQMSWGVVDAYIQRRC